MTKKILLSRILVLIGLIFGVVGLAYAQVVSGSISNQLDVGSRGADVTKLQTLLATNGDIYPSGLVTGYFGSLTAKAVTQFQLAYGLPPVGRVGPLTMNRLNSLLALPAPTLDIYAPSMSSMSVAPTSGEATITWVTNEAARGAVYFDLTPLAETEATTPMTAPTISGMSVQEPSFSTNHSLILNNLQSGRIYYYVVESVDSTGNVSVTVPATFVTTQ